MSSFSIRRRHIPYYDQGVPLYPETVEVVSPFCIRNMQNWYWKVTIEVHTLHYFIDGNAEYELNGKPFKASRGTANLFRPGDRLFGKASDDKPVSVFSSHFDAIPDTFDKDKVLRAEILEMGLFESLANQAIRQVQIGDELALKQVDASLQSMYYLFLGNLDRKPISPIQSKVENVINRIQANVGFDWSIDYMCEEVGLSRTQINRWFNMLTGMSPTRYVIHQRVGRAKQRLGMSSSTISEIAAELGYRDVQFFTRQFTKVMGYPPSKIGGRRKSSEEVNSSKEVLSV